MFPLLTYAKDVEMLEIAVGIEVETNQNRNDLRVRHHVFPSALEGITVGLESPFRHLNFKFLSQNHRQYRKFG